MLGKLIRGAVLLILAVMVVAWAWSVGTSQPREPQDSNAVINWYM
jgi:hypothetical protein